MSTPDFDTIAEAVSPAQLAQAIGAKQNGKDFHCPSSNHADGDKNPSLSINQKDGRTVAYCHSCGLTGTPVQVASDLWGMTPGDAATRLASELGISTALQSSGSGLGELVHTYDYVDKEGAYLSSVRRYALPKGFRQGRRQGAQGWAWGRGGAPYVLYRLPDVVAGVSKGRLVFIAEGEKDADLLAAHGFVATTNVGGAGKWRPEYSESLRGARIVIIPDNDQPGRAHTEAVAQAIHGIVSGIRVVDLPNLPKKGDVSDWFQAGGTVRSLSTRMRHLGESIREQSPV